MNKFLIGGTFFWETLDVHGRVRASGKMRNGVCNAALNDILAVYFQSGTPHASYYLAPIDSTSFTGLAAADTAASHSGWVEGTQYSEATRPQWSPPAVANQQIANVSPVVFSVNTLVTWLGLSVWTANTKSGTSGLLWATATYDTPQILNAGEAHRVYYVLAAAGNG